MIVRRSILVVLALGLLAGVTSCNKNSLGALPPDIAVSPAALTFTASAFSGGTSSAALTLIVSNAGSGPLTVTDISFSAATSPEFAYHLGGAATLPLHMGGGEWTAVQVIYTPTDFVQDTGSLLITSNDPDEHVVEVPIDTAALGPQLACAPNPVTFVQAPGTPTSRVITCNNAGTAPINVTGFDFAAGTSAEFTAAYPATPQTLDPGATLAPFQVTYTPADIGTDAGQILVHNDAGADYVIDLSGEGTNAPLCDLSAFPFFLGFNSVTIGTTSNKSVLLTNNGNATCHISHVQVNALTTEYFYAGSQSITIAPNATAPVSVSYKPIDRITDIGTLEITSDAANSPTTVLLTGVGVGPRIDVLPCPVDFGLVTVGCKVDRPVTVFNTGNGPLTITSTTLGAGTPEFSIVTPPPATIAANSSANALVRLAATSAGMKTRQLLVASNDANEPVFACTLEGTGTTNNHQTDTFVQPTSPQADILFVVDNSGSMSANQTTLINSFQSFANYLVAQNVSYHVGVTTTDVDPTGEQGKLVGNPKIIDNATANGAAKFAANANVGTNGSSEEQGLEAARRALTVPLVTADNAGFLRQAARLFLVFVSDEDDQSPDGQSSQPSTYFVNAFRNIKGANNPNLLSASAIAGDVPNGCATAVTGTRYKEVVDAIGGVFGSICQSNFSPTLQQIGIQASAPQQEFFLSREPVPATIVVKVNGVVQPATAWTYVAAANAVTFGNGSIPPLGSTIVIDYTVVCETP